MESPIEQGDLDFSSLELDPDDIYLPMGRGYRPTPEMEATLAELKQESTRVCTPQYYVRYLPAGPSRGGMLQAGDTCFHAGGIIASALRPANRYALFIVTAGFGFEKLQQKAKEDIYRAFLLDALGTAIAEASVRALCARIETQLPPGEYISHPYSPGYCGWDISEQEKVFALLHPDPQVVRLNASCLMTPIKSVSGILGLGPEIRKQAYGCKTCGRRDCYKNRER